MVEEKKNEEKRVGLAEVRNQTFLEKYGSCRWIIAYLTCLARLSQTALRQFMGMSVVCMQDGISHLSNNQSENGTIDLHTYVKIHNETYFKVAEFDWPSEFEGLLLTSYTIGFIFTPVAGGFLAGKFGSKIVIGMSLIFGSMATLATPIAARWSAYSVIALRIVVGFFMGTVDPAIQGVWSKWAPKYEKSQLTTTSFSGVAIAGIITFFISGFLCDLRLDNGWPFTYYAFGGFTALVLIPWVFLVYDDPDSHPRITEKEQKLIFKGNVTSGAKKMPNPPWGKIFTSLPFWSIIIAHISYSWVTSWVMSYLPTYMKEILEYDIKENGILASMPFVGRFLSGLICGYISDALLQRHLLTTAQVRKLFQITGNIVCAACTITIGFLGKEHRTLAVILLIVGLSFQNFTSVAFRINHLDIAPRYASVLMGITMTCAFAAALSAPLITGAIIQKHTREEWQIVFLLVAAFNVFGGVIFVIFAKGEIQDWAKDTGEIDVECPTKDNTEKTTIALESKGKGEINGGFHHEETGNDVVAKNQNGVDHYRNDNGHKTKM